MYALEPGDILVYRQLETLEVREIDFIERLKDKKQPYYYYHCSVAFDTRTQIESEGKTVRIREIGDSGFDVFRLPVSLDERNRGLTLLQGLIGQKYDWVLIVDDVLRAFTHNLIHLPV